VRDYVRVALDCIDRKGDWWSHLVANPFTLHPSAATRSESQSG
jgi:hypothetical protein